MVTELKPIETGDLYKCYECGWEIQVNYLTEEDREKSRELIHTIRCGCHRQGLWPELTRIEKNKTLET